MMPELKVSFEPGKLEEMKVQFGKKRSCYPYLSLRDYFSDPQASLASGLEENRHVIAFTYKLPDCPLGVWYFIKTAEVAQKVLNAPRYGCPEKGHPWGEGAHTAILRSALAIDQSPGAGTHNVMTTGADKHETYRKPLREGLIKELSGKIPLMAACIEGWMAQNITFPVFDLNSLCRGLVQNTVLTVVGLPENTVTLDEISQLNKLAHEIARGEEGAKERMRKFRESIDEKVVEGMKSLKEGTLFSILKKKGYSDLDCRETIVALMIGARNGSTVLIHLIWLLARHSEMQEAIAEEVLRVREKESSWEEVLKQMPRLQNLFRFSLIDHSPVRTMNRNAINPMVLKIEDEHGLESYGIFPGDRVDYLMAEAAKDKGKDKDIQSCLKEEGISQDHLAFGVGPNRCPASKFIESIAMMTAGMLVSGFKLQCDKAQIKEVLNVFVNEFVDEFIPVKVEPR